MSEIGQRMRNDKPADEALQGALAECRVQIDSIDRDILASLNRRTKVVEEIGRIKQNFKAAVYEPKREEEVYRNVTANNHGPLPHDAVRRIFERIIDEMRTIQKQRQQQARPETDQGGRQS